MKEKYSFGLTGLEEEPSAGSISVVVHAVLPPNATIYTKEVRTDVSGV